MFWARGFFSIQQFPVGELLWLPSLCLGKSGSQWLQVHVDHAVFHNLLVICIWFLEYGETWGNHGPATFGDTLLTNADITDILRTAYLQTPQQRKTLLFRISRAKFGRSQHLTLPRRSLHVQRVQHRKKSAGSCGVFFGCIWLCLKVSKDTVR